MSLETSQSNAKLCTLLLLVLITGLGLGVYAKYTQTVVDGWDPLAYLYAGERIAKGKGPTLCHPYNEAIGPYFTLAGFNIRIEEGPCLYLNYPLGFPLLLAAAQVVTGLPDAALYVPALLGALGIVVTFSLGAVLFDCWVGVIGAVIIALTPAYLAASTSPWADLAATVFVTGGIALYLWELSFPMAQRQRSAVVSFCASVLLVYGLFVRYSSVVALLPLALSILVSQKRKAFKRPSNWLFGGFIVLGVFGILAFNRAYYGDFLTTGYSPRHGWYTWSAFSLRYALGASPVGGKSLTAVLKTLLENFRWLLVPGVVGLMLMPAHKRTLMGGLVFCFALFYGVYAFAPEGINARFLLPTFPALALAVANGLRYGVVRWGWPDRKARLWSLSGGILLVIALLLPLAGRLKALDERNTSASKHIATVQSLVRNSPSDAVFLAYGLNDPIIYYGERTGLFYRRMPPLDPVAGTFRWDQLEPRLVEAVTELLKRDVSVYYVQDSDPPYANSLDMLRRHFRLTEQQANPLVYKVQWGPEGP